mmetsp:Transcript_154902/g.496384  ORF Transcript_154902/g.496384 Transcript_154902/m.496384 type:complete len:247 (+) Transcript_154902:1324-2064(+)
MLRWARRHSLTMRSPLPSHSSASRASIISSYCSNCLRKASGSAADDPSPPACSNSCNCWRMASSSASAPPKHLLSLLPPMQNPQSSSAWSRLANSSSSPAAPFSSPVSPPDDTGRCCWCPCNSAKRASSASACGRLAPNSSKSPSSSAPISRAGPAPPKRTSAARSRSKPVAFSAAAASLVEKPRSSKCLMSAAFAPAASPASAAGPPNRASCSTAEALREGALPPSGPPPSKSARQGSAPCACCP